MDKAKTKENNKQKKKKFSHYRVENCKLELWLLFAFIYIILEKMLPSNLSVPDMKRASQLWSLVGILVLYLIKQSTS